MKFELYKLIILKILFTAAFLNKTLKKGKNYGIKKAGY